MAASTYSARSDSKSAPKPKPAPGLNDQHMKNLSRPETYDPQGTNGELTPVDLASKPPDTSRIGTALADEAPPAATPAADMEVTSRSHTTRPAPKLNPDLPQTTVLQAVEHAETNAEMAWITGRSLRFPLNARLIPGEKLSVSGRRYILRSLGITHPMFWMRWGGIAALGVFALIGVFSLFGETPRVTIDGVVISRSTAKIIPNASVDVKGGPIVKTNAAGLYTIDDLETGTYQMTASAAGFLPQTGTITHKGTRSAQLSFALVPITSDTTEKKPAPVEASSSGSEPVESARPQIAYGHVKLDVDVDRYLVFVDDVLYGRNTEEVKRLTAGQHSIVLQVEGFEDHSSRVTIRPRATQTLRIAKSDLTPKHNPYKKAKAFFATAKDHLDQAQWAAAIEAYNQGLVLDPQNADALQYRGWAHLKTHNAELAWSDLTLAGDLHSGANRYLDAIACAGYLIEINPDSPEGYRRRAEYHVALTEYSKAIKDYETAIKRDKDELHLRLALAETHFVAGNYRDAAKSFDRARKYTTDQTDVYVRMLISLTRAGEDKKVRGKYKDFTEFADPDRLEKLRQNPEWLRVLQIVDPTKRSDG